MQHEGNTPSFITCENFDFRAGKAPNKPNHGHLGAGRASASGISFFPVQNRIYKLLKRAECCEFRKN